MRVLSGPDQPMYAELRRLTETHERGRLRAAVAWLRDEGAFQLLGAVGDRLAGIELIVGLNDAATTVEGLLRALAANASVRVFFKHPRQTFHPKLYMFDGGNAGPNARSAVVGSVNLTPGGLDTNFELSLGLEASTPEDLRRYRSVFDDLDNVWNDYSGSRFCHSVSTAADVQGLYAAGYVTSETEFAGRARVAPPAARTGGASEARPRLLPILPPVRSRPGGFARMAVPFPLAERGDAIDDRDPPRVQPLPGRFFVRTLTANDVSKLMGAPGTFEPDLGETARDRFPSFWGWRNKYVLVRRTKERLEWEARGRLISRITPADGVDIDVLLWFREGRPGHAPEHRLRPGPIGIVRAATPPEFDTRSLLVVERARVGVDFVLRLVTPRESDHGSYASYLTELRPEHRFGYGP